MIFTLCSVVICASLLLGGATSSGFAADAVLQLIAVPLLILASWHHLRERPTHGRSRSCIGLACVGVLIAGQLVQLPSGLWTSLPQRTLTAEGAQLAGLDISLARRTLSVAPQQTWLAAMSVLPPLAVFMGVSLLSIQQRRQLALAIIGIGLLGTALGLLQAGQGPNSPVRFYEISNPTDPVGFFANRNHFAALNYVVAMLLAGWLIGELAASSRRVQSQDSARLLYIVAGAAGIGLLLAAQAMTRSRAGILLMLIAFGLSLMAGLHMRSSGQKFGSARPVAVVVALALAVTLENAFLGVLERFASDPTRDYRIRFGQVTMAAALTYFPWGSGLGSFVPVYQSFEGVSNLTLGVYANRAHNDALEFLLEAGLPGVICLTVMLGWLGSRIVRAWRQLPSAAQSFDTLLPLLSGLSVVLLCAHSFVDYPLRTTALAVVAAFCAALLLPARPAEAAQVVSRSKRARKVAAREPPPARPVVDLVVANRQQVPAQPGASSTPRWPTPPKPDTVAIHPSSTSHGTAQWPEAPEARPADGADTSSSSSIPVWPQQWRRPRT